MELIEIRLSILDFLLYLVFVALYPHSENYDTFEKIEGKKTSKDSYTHQWLQIPLPTLIILWKINFYAAIWDVCSLFNHVKFKQIDERYFYSALEYT